MSAYVEAEDVAVLQRFIVRTFVCGVHSEAVVMAKADRCQWMLKPNGGGKGVGIVFGRSAAAFFHHNISRHADSERR